jgi:hypothetical protein
MRTIGRICFGLMWIPFIGLFVGMIGMPDGDYAFSDMPPLTRYSIVGVGFFMVASIGLQVGALLLTGTSNRSLQKNGRLADATILTITDTGTWVNNRPVVRFTLEVRPPGEPPFQAEAERLVSPLEIPHIQPGMELPVRYDPASKAVALVNEDGGSFGS